MNTREENGKLYIELEARIDTNNAPQTEQELFSILNAHPGIVPVMDAGKLEYISSAGLRVLLKIRKTCGQDVEVINVSQPVYEIFTTTGFDQLLSVKKRLRELSIEGLQEIGSGGYSKVYRIDPETIVKVYKPQLSMEFVEKERALSQKAFLHGISTAISFDVVSCGDSYGVVYELLNCGTVAETISAHPERVSELGARMGTFLKDLHGLEIPEDLFPDRKNLMLSFIEKLKSYLEEAEYAKLYNFVDAIPQRNSFIHGDYHAKNVMIQGDDFVLIDIGDAGIGHPVFDIAEDMLANVLFPKSNARSEAERADILGFALEDAGKLWGGLVGGYFGVRTPEEIGSITQKLMPYAYLQMAYQSITLAAGTSREEMQGRVDRLVRGLLLPAIDTAGELFF